MPRNEELKNALRDSLAGRRRLLRATEAYLLPEEVRLGFELAMVGVRDGLLDEAMHDLEELPVLTLAQAMAEDLQAAAEAAEESATDAAGGSLEPREVEVAATVATAGRTLRQTAQDLRRVLEQAAGGRLPTS